MTDGDGISRRKALGGIALTGVAAAGGGAGTYAYLADSDSVDSMFEVGSLDLETTPSGGALTFESLAEGEQNTSTIDVCNDGSLPIRNVILDGITISGDTEVAKAIKVREVTYGGDSVADPSQIGDDNDNGISDLHDLNAWLQPDGLSLTSSTSQGTLNGTDAGGGECTTLVIKTEMDYSVLSDVSDNASISASVDLVGEQKPL
jgi:predicted ribosomally synthesized peptide with SipW-like signal peptide